MNTTHYVFLTLRERNGEYEYYHRSVHHLQNIRENTADKIAKNYLKDFYGGEPEKKDGGYYFHGGEVFVRIDGLEFIGENEYKVLRKYL
jgi:hypothetical protein